MKLRTMLQIERSEWCNRSKVIITSACVQLSTISSQSNTHRGSCIKTYRNDSWQILIECHSKRPWMECWDYLQCLWGNTSYLSILPWKVSTHSLSLWTTDLDMRRQQTSLTKCVNITIQIYPLKMSSIRWPWGFRRYTTSTILADIFVKRRTSISRHRKSSTSLRTTEARLLLLNITQISLPTKKRRTSGLLVPIAKRKFPRKCT